MAMLRTRRIAVGRIEEAQRDRESTHPLATVIADVFTCPAGYRAILRDWRILLGFAADPNSFGVIPYLLPAGGVIYYTNEWHPTGRENSNIEKQTDMVLEPGDTVGLLSNLPPVDYWISGALVTLPA